MFPLFVAVLFVGCSPVSAESEYSALRFGQTKGDYIEWSPDMSTATTQFSVCTWIRKRYNQVWSPVVLYYYRPISYGMVLGDNGFYNQVVGTNLDLRSEYSVPEGHWFHVCMVWSTSDYTTRVYLNGVHIGSKVTYQREVRTGGMMCLGNSQGYKSVNYIFGGDLYKMNIYNRVLSHSEIRSMSSDMCSTEEERLTAYRIIKWEGIILKRRTGRVTEISSGCHEKKPHTEPQQRPVVTEETESETEQELTKTKTNIIITLDDILRRLQNTERELAETKANFSQRLENVTISLTSTQVELETCSTKQELAKYRSNLTSTQVELDSIKQELAETRTDLKISVEKLERVTMSLNHTLEQLEAAKKDKVRSKWDVLYSEKFLNKKLTREMSQELRSTGNLLGQFVGMNISITEELITYLKRHHEEDMVCLNTGN